MKYHLVVQTKSKYFQQAKKNEMNNKYDFSTKSLVHILKNIQRYIYIFLYDVYSSINYILNLFTKVVLPSLHSATPYSSLQHNISLKNYFNAFRKRFGCKLGRLRSGPPMPLQEKQSKVGMGHETFRDVCFVKGNPPRNLVRRNTSNTSNDNNVLGSDCEAAMFWLFSCLVGRLNLSDWWGIACSFLFW